MQPQLARRLATTTEQLDDSKEHDLGCLEVERIGMRGDQTKRWHYAIQTGGLHIPRHQRRSSSLTTASPRRQPRPQGTADGLAATAMARRTIGQPTQRIAPTAPSRRDSASSSHGLSIAYPYFPPLGPEVEPQRRHPACSIVIKQPSAGSFSRPSLPPHA